MKKQLILLFMCSILAISCKKEANMNTDNFADMKELSNDRPNSATMEVLEAELLANPGLKAKMDAIERLTESYIAKKRALRKTNESDLDDLQGLDSEMDDFTIPVVINVISRTMETAVTQQQIQDQIDVLNADFNANNRFLPRVPSIFRDHIANVGIKFKLEKINRRVNERFFWTPNHDMKRSNNGGIDPTNPKHNLNIWVVDQMLYAGSYAMLPGGDELIDGVVMSSWAFGGFYTAAVGRGSFTTREVGHWMNLLPIWGGQYCGDDLVDDTPPHSRPNYNCPSYPLYSRCTGNPVRMMTMNFMDFTTCGSMFTKGQKDRMLAIFSPGGPRAAFISGGQGNSL